MVRLLSFMSSKNTAKWLQRETHQKKISEKMDFWSFQLLLFICVTFNFGFFLYLFWVLCKE